MDAVLEAQDRTVSRRRGALPFVGRVIAATQGESVIVERVLHLDEDLYLADHAFVHAPGVKPLSACLPVLPMTMSIEAMAEVAACVVPGQGLIGVEEIKATRWIDLVDVEATTLTIEAHLDRYDPQRDATFVRAAIRAEGQSGPSIEATMLFGRHYLLELFPDFGALDVGVAQRIDAATLYGERHLFHGPAFRCLFGEVFVEDRRIAGHLRIPSPAGLFRSTAEPQLLLQPCVLDAICQMVGVYAMQRDRYAFPVGLGKLELYRPTPPAGTLVPVRIELRKTDGKTIHADIEAEDGEGGVWMRVADLRCWKFQWERRLVDYRRAPAQFLLSRPAPVGDTDAGPLALLLAEPDLGKFDPRMLARDCLGLEEAAVYESHARFPARQRQWLLGRAVAKDCVRRWISDRTGAEMAHPAAILVRSDPAGRPYVAGADGCEALPHISIAHCEDRAIAAAHGGRVGVDIERIADRDDGFLAAVAGPDERENVKALGAARRAEWITRLWGAKEAVGKLLGSGVDGRLKSLEAVDFSPEGSVRIQDRETMSTYAVETIESDGFIIACVTEDAPLPPRGEECASA